MRCNSESGLTPSEPGQLLVQLRSRDDGDTHPWSSLKGFFFATTCDRVCAVRYHSPVLITARHGITSRYFPISLIQGSTAVAAAGIILRDAKKLFALRVLPTCGRSLLSGTLLLSTRHRPCSIWNKLSWAPSLEVLASHWMLLLSQTTALLSQRLLIIEMHCRQPLRECHYALGD